jgi:diguanylate cyclase (GGDEF)-like protein
VGGFPQIVNSSSLLPVKELLSRVRLYPLLRVLAFPIFLAYLGVRLAIPEISILGDLILFNLVALIAAISVLAAHQTPLRSRIPISLAILSWSVGSTISSWNALNTSKTPGWLSDAGYLSFYPLLFFGLMSTLRQPHAKSRLHLLDSLIIAIGISSLLSILALTATRTELTITNYELILQNLYPIADVLLVATGLVILIRSGLDTRNLLTLLALTLFTFTDIIFLIQSAQGSYRFGSIIDSGWLIALLLIAESQWHHQSERIKGATHPLLATVIAALGSSLVIALRILTPDRLPNGAIIPAFATLILAFIRMSLALIEAQRLNEVTLLAKTDELTGLANRRHFIEELQNVKRGDFLILIDLNGFKPINDTYGHSVGDELLRQSSLRLARTFDREWTFARLGGDEFGVLIKGGGRPDEIANSIAASFSYPFHLGAIGEVRIGASIGVAVEEGGGELLRQADLAMYHAKRTGQPIAYWSQIPGATTTVSPLADRR